MSESHSSELHLKVLASGPQRRVNDTRRYLILTVGTIGMICSSFGYAFSIVLASLQTRYNFTQRETASIACVGLVFGYFMLPFSFLFDYFGPLPIILLSLIMFPLGCVMTALCYEGVIEGTVVRLCVFNALQSIGMSLSDLVCCMTVLSHFPANRGPVIALLKTCLGLGSAVVGSLYTGFFNGQLSHYLYFLTALSFTVNLGCLATMRLAEYQLTGYEESHLDVEEKKRRVAREAAYLKQKPVMWRFIFGFVVLIVLIVYLPTTSAMIAYHSLGRDAKLAFGIVTALLTGLLLLIGVPVPAAVARLFSCCAAKHQNDEGEDAEAAYGGELTTLEADHRAPHSSMSEAEPCQPEKRTGHAGDDAAERMSDNIDGTSSEDLRKNAGAVVETDVDYLAPQYQGTFLKNLRTLELWALWWTLFCVVGTEFVIIYNASFVLAALQGYRASTSLTALLTVLNGVGSAAGRLLMSAFEVWTQKRRAEDRIPITVALFFPTGSIIIAIVLFLALPAVALPLPYIVAALGNGFCAASQILVIRTIYAKDSAKHYHFCFSSTMVATILLNRFLYGEWYTVQAEKQANANNLCYGKGCVLMPLCVLLGLAGSAFLTDVVVHFRYRAYSLKVLAERARLRGEVQTPVEEGEIALLDDGLASESGERNATRTA